VPLPVVEGIVLFCSGKYSIVPGWSWAPDPYFVIYGVENLIDGEPEQGEVLCQLKCLERTRERTESACLL